MQAAGDKRQVTTEIATAKPFYYAEDDHQQYLHKIRTATAALAASASVCLHNRTDYGISATQTAWRAAFPPATFAENVTSGRFTRLYAILPLK